MAYPDRIEGERALYERWSFESHTDAFAALCADPEVMTFLGGPQAFDDSVGVSRRLDEHWDTYGFGLWAAVVDGACAGFSGACHPGPTFQPEYATEVELGWRLARPAWGLGLATEGAQLALAALPAHVPLRRVVAFVHPDNARSLAVVNRLGMQTAGTFHDRRLDVLEHVFEHALEAA